MQYAQEQNGRALSSIVGAGGGSNVSRTMAQRLEEAAGSIAYQCERIERTLAKINGTPFPPGPTTTGEKIKTTAPLCQSLEFVETSAKRLGELASNLEQVA